MDEKWICPHCGEMIYITKSNEAVLDQMGRNWHKECWEEFKAEYNDVLDSTDLNKHDKES